MKRHPNNHYIDTHCHFDFPPFVDDIAHSIALLQRANVNKVIIPAVNADRFELISQLCSQHAPLYMALGLHPIYSHAHSDLALLEHYLQSYSQQHHHSKCVAIGEIGLDGYIEQADFTQQLQLLRAQFELSNQFKLPVILHSRKSHALLLKEIKAAKLLHRGVIHGFSGSYEEAKQFIQQGFYIGVGGVISYERANKTRQAISKIPLDFIVLETDSPDMPLQGYQGQANRPEQILRIAEILAQLRGVDVQNIAETCYANSLTLFSRMIE